MRREIQKFDENANGFITKKYECKSIQEKEITTLIAQYRIDGDLRLETHLRRASAEGSRDENCRERERERWMKLQTNAEIWRRESSTRGLIYIRCRGDQIGFSYNFKLPKDPSVSLNFKLYLRLPSNHRRARHCEVANEQHPLRGLFYLLFVFLINFSRFKFSFKWKKRFKMREFTFFRK